MEVRCCCEPLRLLGTLPVPKRLRRGESCTFLVQPARIYWQLRRPPYAGSPFTYRHERAITLTLEAAEWGDGEGQPGVALKGDHTSLETLRRIRGFEEATHGTGF